MLDWRGGFRSWEVEMKSRKKVSIIIPCYNQARFLPEAIESALCQKYRPLEVILIDDGSEDETPEVAARYEEVKFIRQCNMGLASARNRGLVESNGEYVTFLDADDRFLPNAVEAGVRALDDHPQWAFAYGRYRLIDADGCAISSESAEVSKIENCYEEMLRRNFICMHGTVMYRRAILESVGGFDQSLHVCEDYDLYLRVCRRFPIGGHNELVAEYRKHDESVSRNHAKMLETSIKVLRRQYSYIKETGCYLKAYHDGLRFWQEFYGDLLFEDIRKRVHDFGYISLLQSSRDLLTLLRCCPLRFVLHGYRKSRVAILRGLRMLFYHLL